MKTGRWKRRAKMELLARRQARKSLQLLESMQKMPRSPKRNLLHQQRQNRRLFLSTMARMTIAIEWDGMSAPTQTRRILQA